MTKPTPPIVPVTPADREAYLEMNTLPRHLAEDVRAGRWDHTTGMQVLARHRIAHSAPTGEVEAYAEKLAECLAKACGDIAALLIFGNREGDIRPWTAEYAAVLNAYDGKYETPAYPRPSWQAPVHADDCEAMERPRADCTCVPVARTYPAPPADLVELVTILHQYRSDMLRPPAPDSRERRVAMIDAAIAKFGSKNDG